MKIIFKIAQIVGAGALIVLFAGSAQAVLVNGDFETPDASGGDIGGTPTGWTGSFNNNFTISNQFDSGNQAPVAVSGTQMLKQFGPFAQNQASGTFQDLAAVPGQIWEASVFAQQWDQCFPGPAECNLTNNGDLQLFFLDAAKANLSGGFTPFAEIQFGPADLPDNVWTKKTVQGLAPVDTAFARIQLLHIQINDPVTGGAIYYDDADLKVIPVPAAVWLFGSGLVGLIGVARRRRKA